MSEQRLADFVLGSLNRKAVVGMHAANVADERGPFSVIVRDASRHLATTFAVERGMFAEFVVMHRAAAAFDLGFALVEVLLSAREGERAIRFTLREEAINCDCGKGLYCPLIEQEVIPAG